MKTRMKITVIAMMGMGLNSMAQDEIVNGNLTINGSISNTFGQGSTLTLFDDNTSRKNRIILGADSQGAYIKSTWGNSGTDAISFRNSENNRIFNILEDSTVGIGTTDTKGFKLGVNGNIIATEIKVSTYSNWADFVLKKIINYQP